MSDFAKIIETDAADRLILDEASAMIPGAAVLVVESLALAVAARAAGAARVTTWFDSSSDADDALALGFPAAADGTDASTAAASTATVVTATAVGVDVVLLRLPKSLRALDALARRIAATADESVTVFAGARLKYMTPRMNEVLRSSFEQLDVSLARQKSRVLIARRPRAVETPEPQLTRIDERGLTVGSVGGVFAGDALDLGTRALLEQFTALPEFETAIDLGCGTGILAAELKRLRPDARVVASDVSADAIASARATMRANELDVEVVQESALAGQPDESADLVLLNPPFHDGGPISTELAAPLFDAAARVLRPGGQLWTVFNSSLGYRPALERIVGTTRQVSRTSRFTVTASIREVAIEPQDANSPLVLSRHN